MKIKTLTLALLAITIMSCNTGKKSNANPEVSGNDAEMTTPENTADVQSIENTKWIITTLEGQDMSDREENGQVIYFTLNSEDNRVNGFSGCNSFMGTYKLEEGNRISFSQMGVTKMACPDAKIDESQILSVFEHADNFTITDGKLALNKAKRAPLATFKKGVMEDESIVGKYWKLKTLQGQDVQMADNQEREIYFTLQSQDNRVNGFAGCNTVNGEYTLEEGNRIRFKGMMTTLKACPDVDVNESEFLEVFELADNYTIVDDVLSLNVGRRAPLAVFEAVYFD
ncbi:META domain-containing protein [Gelidibacter maritimus]|uniref:META domain-containing protein n=1 Tax=Gelidibacter maritimus TaxID=2761487 RepID=A0A7W2M244_9FLAO|nr:META domain-containing protein [Gelidibacter maritimus]MBA6151327.1 META domain-containing protein [Gelidibacter maritimus]